MMTRSLLILTLLASLAGAAHADLFEYVALEDDAYTFEVGPTTPTPQGKVHAIQLTSQVWQDITWTHRVRVYEPLELEIDDVVGLMITGGGPDVTMDMMGLKVANMMGARFAVLYDIPNQPAFDGLTEDALISYTWMQYLATGDETWPLLFPMVKATLRAMDCLEQVAEEEWDTDVRGFFVTGASKRGWTTYLTGIADPVRVIGIAPMVFDILNMPVSIQHQVDFWGSYSPMIDDYTEKGLQTAFETPEGFRLAWIMDPYTYRNRLTMPKLIVLGSNDPYWPIDAVNYYYLGLPTPRALIIAPNSGHGLDDIDRVLASTSGVFKLTARGQSLPPMRWDYVESPEGVALVVTAPGPEGPEATGPVPTAGRVWVARSAIQDFRKATWEEVPLEANGDAFSAMVLRAEGQYTACYGEIEYTLDGKPLYFSTQPRVLHPVAQ